MRIALLLGLVAVPGLGVAAAGISPEQAAIVREYDRTGTPEAQAIREGLRALREGRAPRAVTASAIAPANGMTVSDAGRITVVRDATGAVWGPGANTGFDDLVAGIDGSITAYYEAHPGADPDYIVFVQDWLNLGFAGAFYLPQENDVLGIGYSPPTFDEDPSTGIEGILWLNGVQILQADFFSRLLWGQEFGHRWGSFVRFDDGGQPSNALLGRQLAHWSYYLDTDWSWFEGNDWRMNVDGTWTTATETFESTTHFSALDLYLMGLVGTSDVPAFTLLTGPSGGPNASAPPAGWPSTGGGPVTVSAIPQTVTVQDIIAVEGRRVPSHLDSPKSFEVVVLYIARKDDRITPQKLVVVNEILDRMLASWDEDTAGRATIEFGPAGTPNQAPAATLDAPASAKTGKGVRFSAASATDPEGEPLRFWWRFADEAEFAEAGAEVSKKFATTGTKFVEVSVRDASGGETILTHELTVTEGAASCGCSLASHGRARASLFGAVLALLAGWLPARSRRRLR